MFTILGQGSKGLNWLCDCSSEDEARELIEQDYKPRDEYDAFLVLPIAFSIVVD